MRAVLKPPPLADSVWICAVPPFSLALSLEVPPTVPYGQVCTEDLEQAAAAPRELPAIHAYPVWSGILYTIFLQHFLFSQLLLLDTRCMDRKPAEDCRGENALANCDQ